MLNKPEMTLRDYFAGHAVMGILANETITGCMARPKRIAIDNGATSGEFEKKIEFPVYAWAAYGIADVMMAEREKGQPHPKPAKKAEPKKPRCRG